MNVNRLLSGLDTIGKNFYIAVMEKLNTTTAVYDGHVSEDRKSILISAPAKINLFLKVTGRRHDGYHDIFSWFQTIDLFDTLKIELSRYPEIEITTNLRDLPTDEGNLVFKAARLIQKQVGLKTGFRIQLHKSIPVAAGLGGGSSDAAAFIRAVNILCKLHLSRKEMEKSGLEIGSDLPFFFGKGQSEVSGRGEKVRDIKVSTDYELLLITPDFQIRAAEAYRKVNLDLTESLPGINFPCCRQVNDLIDVISKIDNDLENALMNSYPILDRMRRMLLESGADIVRLSGSGPTMFALYRHRCKERKELARLFEADNWGVNFANPVVLPA